jgi:hypothetical protein
MAGQAIDQISRSSSEVAAVEVEAAFLGEGDPAPGSMALAISARNVAPFLVYDGEPGGEDTRCRRISISMVR